MATFRHVPNDTRDLYTRVVRSLQNYVVNQVRGMVRSQVSFTGAPELDELIRQTHELDNLLAQTPTSVPDKYWPCLKRAVLEARLELANQIDEQKARTGSPEVMLELDRQLEPYQQIMGQSWFREAKPVRLPRLTDYLTLERVETHGWGQAVWEKRVYDEKFHILQAPSLFLPDLDYYRKTCCGLRGVPVTVAYMDVDDFKRNFNQPHGEEYIDLHMLRRLMRELEAHVYARGHAYRFGGDEYGVILPNTDRAAALVLLTQLQDRVGKLSYTGIDARATLSIGYCHVGVDCHLTNAELRAKAERAKNKAKEVEGKGRIATYADEWYEEVILEPARESI